MKVKQNLWELLEDAPIKVVNVAALYSWSLNYDQKFGSPFKAFLDLTGYSEEFLDEKINADSFQLDFASAGAFGQALVEWANRPGEVLEFIDAILKAEQEL
jgi:hypothetical protein